jgi:hypothetical protein
VILQPREGVEQRYLLIRPDAPKAAVILFAGGKGALNLGKGLFGGASINWGREGLPGMHPRQFAGQELMVAVVDAPSDNQGKRGMLGGFRISDDPSHGYGCRHRRPAPACRPPIWLVGTSRGTESTANVAIYSAQQPNGLVLTSSMSEANGGGDAVTEMPIDQIRMPTLIGAHEQDGCDKTPPAGAEEIREDLTGARKAEVKYFSVGHQESDPCKAMSHHGFLGIEDEVVAYITEFIKAN